MWADYFAQKPTEADFKYSLVDECLCCNSVVLLCCVNDGLWISKKDSSTDTKIILLQSNGLKTEDQGNPNDYVGVNIAKVKDYQYMFTQASLEVIQVILLNKLSLPAKYSILKEDIRLNMHFTNIIICVMVNSCFYNYKLIISKAILQALDLVREAI